jgi:hypothetical protein
MPCHGDPPLISLRQHEARLWQRAAAAVLIAGLLPGCGRSPQVPFENLRYSAALLTAASSCSPKQLDRVAAVIEDDFRNGQLSNQERAAYDTIITMMRAGRWTEAEAACRQFRKAQLRR